MARDRFATRAAILESAAAIVAAEGVGSLGINALANAARCDKVLIYRYFGGLDGVLRSLGAERMLWPAAQLEDGGGDAGEDSPANAVPAPLLTPRPRAHALHSRANPRPHLPRHPPAAPPATTFARPPATAGRRRARRNTDR